MGSNLVECVQRNLREVDLDLAERVVGSKCIPFDGVQSREREERRESL